VSQVQTRQYKRILEQKGWQGKKSSKPQCFCGGAFPRPLQRKGCPGTFSQSKYETNPKEVSVCVLRLRFFERGVEEKKTIEARKKIIL
jgi:hypothetical protein